MQLVGSDGVPNATKIGGLVAIYYLGSLFGGFLGGWVGDKFGRIKGIGAGALWCMVGGALQAGAVDTHMMLVARVIAGIGCGHLNVITPAWTAEVSEARERGKMIALVFMANYIGIAVAYWLAYGLSYVDGGQGDFRWRFGLAFQVMYEPMTRHLLTADLHFSCLGFFSCFPSLLGGSLKLGVMKKHWRSLPFFEVMETQMRPVFKKSTTGSLLELSSRSDTPNAILSMQCSLVVTVETFTSHVECKLRCGSRS